jgi:hypothetical protein
MFPVRYELNSCILFRRNPVFKGLRNVMKREKQLSPPTENEELDRSACTYYFVLSANF